MIDQFFMKNDLGRCHTSKELASINKLITIFKLIAFTLLDNNVLSISISLPSLVYLV